MKSFMTPWRNANRRLHKPNCGMKRLMAVAGSNPAGVPLSILVLTCFTACAQTSSTFEATNAAPRISPVVDTNQLAKTRALVAAIQATNQPSNQQWQTNIVFNLPVMFPDWYPVAGYFLHSTDGVNWQFTRPYIATMSQTNYFTNPLPSTNLYMTVLIPPNTISVPNIYPPTNAPSSLNNTN